MVTAAPHQRMGSRGLRRKLCAYRATQGQTLVPPTRAHAHLVELTQNGWTLTGIEATTGVARCALRAILNNARPSIRWTTQQRILVLNVRDPNPRFSVPSHGAARRIQALYALGHPLDVISWHVGRTSPYLSDLVYGRRLFVSAETDAAVRRTYDELGMTVGTSVRAKRRAQKNRWAAPLHWDDEALDDPDGFPDWTGACGTPAGYSRHRKNPLLPPPCQPCKDVVAAEKRHTTDRSCA